MNTELIKKSIVEFLEKPWGASIRLDDSQLDQFLKLYYKGVELPDFPANTSLSPKCLILAPHKRFSWQVHQRRWEVWRIAVGPTSLDQSETDEPPQQPERFAQGDVIKINENMRHRAVGLDNWAVIAEIWVHTDANNPSDEDDIRRIADDFGRMSQQI